MKILKPKFEHHDNRRKLTNLFSVKIEDVNFYEAKKNSILGGHYHKKTSEYFYVVKGALSVMVNGRKFRFIKGGLFVVEPKEYHIIKCLSKSSIMSFLTKEYDKEYPDVFTS